MWNQLMCNKKSLSCRGTWSSKAQYSSSLPLLLLFELFVRPEQLAQSEETRTEVDISVWQTVPQDPLIQTREPGLPQGTSPSRHLREVSEVLNGFDHLVYRLWLLRDMIETDMAPPLFYRMCYSYFSYWLLVKYLHVYECGVFFSTLSAAVQKWLFVSLWSLVKQVHLYMALEPLVVS